MLDTLHAYTKIWILFWNHNTQDSSHDSADLTNGNLTRQKCIRCQKAVLYFQYSWAFPGFSWFVSIHIHHRSQIPQIHACVSVRLRCNSSWVGWKEHQGTLHWKNTSWNSDKEGEDSPLKPLYILFLYILLLFWFPLWHSSTGTGGMQLTDAGRFLVPNLEWSSWRRISIERLVLGWARDGAHSLQVQRARHEAAQGAT